MMNRRGFLKVTASGMVFVSMSSLFGTRLYADDGRLLKSYPKVQLVDDKGRPILATDLRKENPYIFNYPYNSTPCMVINLTNSTASDVELTSESGEKYIWKGGVGNERSIVSYVAICGHQLTHPTPIDSFMSYASPAQKNSVCEKSGVIVCASHMSAFDVKNGAKVCAGPATQPLNGVILEIALDNTIWAIGILGQEKFVDYFDSYADELKEFYKGEKNGKKLASKTVKAVPMNVFSKNIIAM